MSTRTILVTGASGFVGRAVVARILADGREVPRSALRATSTLKPGGETVYVAELGAGADWGAAVRGVQTVIHCAARVHVMRESAADPLAEFRRVNVEGTAALARQAAAAGVERFVFLSSIKVNGEETLPGRPYGATDTPAPADAYGVSKLEAESAVLAIANETAMTASIIRPVLVYGPGVKGNFLTLMRLLSAGVPLPLGAVDNRRSLVALDNLCDLVLTCARHQAAANRTFLLSDGEDMSTTELLRRTAVALGVAARLIPVRTSLLRAAMALTGMGSFGRRLLGSLQVDIAPTRDALGWRPPVAVDAALRAAAEDFLGGRRGGRR